MPISLRAAGCTLSATAWPPTSTGRAAAAGDPSHLHAILALLITQCKATEPTSQWGRSPVRATDGVFALTLREPWAVVTRCFRVITRRLVRRPTGVEKGVGALGRRAAW